ncbi:hypothetical protein ALC62_12529 [Cyphomyrmex costatus]|uniref:Uncharacterized protein n=1 Tax=Cyphomyrmex costatus TaxID=456900 RepID=A0A195C7B5_9HYME|nr:hypothetical protein ALC62_12529 [Cyphomyrmex costatus]
MRLPVGIIGSSRVDSVTGSLCSRSTGTAVVSTIRRSLSSPMTRVFNPFVDWCKHGKEKQLGYFGDERKRTGLFSHSFRERAKESLNDETSLCAYLSRLCASAQQVHAGCTSDRIKCMAKEGIQQAKRARDRHAPSATIHVRKREKEREKERQKRVEG